MVGPAGKAVAIVSGSFAQSGFTATAEDGIQLDGPDRRIAYNLEGISQDDPTVAGKTYTLTFWAGNVSGGAFGTTSSVGLKINGSPAGNYTNSTPATTMKLAKVHLQFYRYRQRNSYRVRHPRPSQR